MSIDRNNYEEYFILYMDNELSLPERRMVEAFLHQHPDLKEELDLLLQYKLVPDSEIIFDRKEELMVPLADRSVPITAANYQDWLILYLDNELSNAEKKAVDVYMVATPSAKKELEILSRTKLEPEEIVFKDKASLYKTEKTEPAPLFRIGGIFADRRWRAAAAILLLLIVGVTTAVIVNKRSSNPGIVKTNPGEKKNETAITQPKQIQPDNNPIITKEDNPVYTPVESKKLPGNFIANSQPIPVINKKDIIKEKSLNKETAVAKNNKPNNNLPQPLDNPNLIKKDKELSAIASNDYKKETIKDNALTKPNVTIVTTDPSDIVQASFKADKLEQPDGKKNKLRGFFRKVTRTFEKRTNMEASDNDDKLLLGGLAIKLK